MIANAVAPTRGVLFRSKRYLKQPKRMKRRAEFMVTEAACGLLDWAFFPHFRVGQEAFNGRLF